MSFCCPLISGFSFIVYLVYFLDGNSSQGFSRTSSSFVNFALLLPMSNFESRTFAVGISLFLKIFPQPLCCWFYLFPLLKVKWRHLPKLHVAFGQPHPFLLCLHSLPLGWLSNDRSVVLKFLRIFSIKCAAFHFALGPENYAGNPVQQQIFARMKIDIGHPTARQKNT